MRRLGSPLTSLLPAPPSTLPRPPAPPLRAPEPVQMSLLPPLLPSGHGRPCKKRNSGLCAVVALTLPPTGLLSHVSAPVLADPTVPEMQLLPRGFLLVPRDLTQRGRISRECPSHWSMFPASRICRLVHCLPAPAVWVGGAALALLRWTDAEAEGPQKCASCEAAAGDGGEEALSCRSQDVCACRETPHPSHASPVIPGRPGCHQEGWGREGG